MRRRTLLLAAAAGGAAGTAGWVWRRRNEPSAATPEGSFTDPAPAPSVPSGRWQAAVGTDGIAPQHDTSSVYLLDAVGTMSALDRATGAVRWRVPTDVNSRGPLVRVDGLLIAGGYGGATQKGLLVAVDAQGNEAWRQSAVRNVVLGSGLARGGLVVPEVQETLYCVDAATGGIRWAVDVPRSNLGLSVPLTDNDRILVEAVDKDSTGVLFCLDPATGGQRWRVPLGADRWAAHPPGAAMPEPDTPMRMAWLVTSGQGLAVACRHRSKIRATASGDPFRTEIVAFDPVDGAVRWVFGSSIVDQYHVNGETLYVSCRQPFDAPKEIKALDVATGRVRWTYRTQGGTAESLEGNLIAFTVGDGVVCVSGSTGLFALDQTTGQLRWQARHPAQFGPATPVIARNTLVVARSDARTKEGGLWRFRLSDGAELPAVALRPVANRLYLAEESLYLLTETATLAFPLDTLG